MRYEVTFVEKHKLPTGKDWMVVLSPTECFVFINPDAVSPTVLAQVWAARRAVMPEAMTA